MTQTAHYLITGGTGFFGRALLRHWTTGQSGALPPARVTLLSRKPEAFAATYPALAVQPWLRLVQGDVCDLASLPRDTAFSHILHAATDATLTAQLTPLQRYDQIVDGTRNLLELAVACSAKRFLLTSSGGVYGVQPTTLEQMPEDWHAMPDPLQAANAYSVAKRAAEHLCALYAQAHGLHTVIARCFAFVGPDLAQDVHFAIGNFIRDALHADAITVNGDGSAVRSYLDQRDLADWLLVMLQQGCAGQAYNLGSDQALTIAELAHRVRDLLAPDKPVHILKKDLGGPRNRYVPSIAKAQQELGLAVTIPLDEAIRYAATDQK